MSLQSVAASSALAGAGGLSKDEFAQSQMEMTRNWYERLLRSGKNVEEHIESRKAAYLMRWREAGRYFGPGGRLLDIGGGNIYAELLTYIRSMNWDYWYVDVGQQETINAAALAASLGFDPTHFSCRLNHELDYEEASFDSVFSSHCIEHSMDVPLTLQQINRLLKSGGNFVMSVPFGFDAQPNHPYFLMENEWVTLLEDAGFQVRAYQVGSEYPESGQDLMIAARKTGPVGAFRLDIDRYVKTSYRFREFKDASVSWTGDHVVAGDKVVLHGADWRAQLTLEAGVAEVLPVFVQHSWSGVVCVRSGANAVYGDLFRPFPVVQALRLKLSEPARAGQIVEIAPVGKNDASVSSQGVLMGYLTR